MYSHSVLVVFVVLLAKCLKWLTNTRTPHVLVHMVVMHTVFYYELVAQGSSCTQSQLFTFIFLQPVGLCTESVRCLDRHCSCFLLAGIDGPVCFKMNQLGSYQVPECENYTSEQ